MLSQTSTLANKQTSNSSLAASSRWLAMIISGDCTATRAHGALRSGVCVSQRRHRPRSQSQTDNTDTDTDTDNNRLSIGAVAPLSALGPGTLRNLIRPEQPARGPDREEEGEDEARAAADWDPSDETEEIDWYSEYVARHGPIAFRWLQAPPGLGDVKGVGLFRGWTAARDDRVVAPLDDGTVCVWDLSHAYAHVGRDGGKGRIVGMSRPGVLTADLSGRGRRSPGRNGVDFAPEFPQVGECVSVDSLQRRAYMAVGNVLNEVDLETLRVVHQTRCTKTIFALSQETDYSAPMTLATMSGLQIYDARLSPSEEEDAILARCEQSPVRTGSDLYSHPDYQMFRLRPDGRPPQRIRSPKPVDRGATYDSLFQPAPLSILHPPAPHVNTILLAGRFPSILCYDRRMFPKLQQAVHSGARLCGLASVPAPHFPVSTEPTQWAARHKIVACGEYNGRGSLELYNLNFNGTDPLDSSSTSRIGQERYQNRQSTASSKVLSVASHGARIVFSDADGNVKWVERDGRDEVRRWNVNTDRRGSSPTGSIDGRADSGMFLTSGPPARSDVVRKIVPTDGNLSADELLIWTGDRIGRLRFAQDREEEVEAEDEPEVTKDERERRQLEQEYSRMMRRALERQADEVRWMGRLGMA